MNTRINILNKEGFLTDEDRKEKLEHGCEYFNFYTCLDLSKPIQVVPYGYDPDEVKEVTLDMYSRDVASFIIWWSYFVKRDLNGFSGFYHTKFIPVGFKIISEYENGN